MMITSWFLSAWFPGIHSTGCGSTSRQRWWWSASNNWTWWWAKRMGEYAESGWYSIPRLKMNWRFIHGAFDSFWVKERNENQSRLYIMRAYRIQKGCFINYSREKMIQRDPAAAAVFSYSTARHMIYHINQHYHSRENSLCCFLFCLYLLPCSFFFRDIVK